MGRVFTSYRKGDKKINRLINKILPVTFVIKLAARMYFVDNHYYKIMKKGPLALSLLNYESRVEPPVVTANYTFLIGEVGA